MEKQCKTCGTTETSKWYTGKTECRSCYRKRIYRRPEVRKREQQSCKKYRENNKEELAKKHKEWVDNNREKVQNYMHNYRREPENKKRNNMLERANYRRRINSDPEYKLKRNLRARFNNAFKGSYVGGKAIRDLGCTISELKNKLEPMFYPHPETGEMMTWDNYGKGSDKWNIDHVKPLAIFDLTDVKQQKEAVHYSNLQPMWEIENLSKGDKYERQNTRRTRR